jgi:hypothetical protein
MLIKRSKLFAVNTLPGTVQEQSMMAQAQQKNPSLTQVNNPQQMQMVGDTNNGELTMRDLQLEQARLRRQQIEIQHQKSQLLLKDEISRRRSMVQMQKMEQEEKDAQNRARIQARKEENRNNNEAGVKNTSLYKTRPKAIQPVGMPRSNVNSNLR